MRRLADQRGFALPMAIGVMLVLTIIVWATLQFTGASARESSLVAARQEAKSLAESGFNRAAAILSQTYDSGGADALPSCAPPTACDSGIPTGQSVEWSTTVNNPTAGNARIWTITGIGTVPNPSGPSAAAIVRTVSGQFELRDNGPSLWRGLYIGNPTARPLLSDSKASIATNVYADGDMTLTQGKYLGESFQVNGKLTLDSSVMYDTSIGASDRVNCSSDYKSFKSDFPAPCTRTEHRVDDLRVAGGCNFSTSGSWTPAKCYTTSANGGPNGKIWLPCPTSPCSSSNVTVTPAALDDIELTSPTVPPATYDLGPAKPCATTTGSPPGFTSSTFELMKTTSYSCMNASGSAELSWNHTTNTLTVKGDIYFTQNMKLQSGRWGLFGPGEGRIFIGGKIELASGTALCGKRGSASPACDNDDADWDPTIADNVVTFITGSTDEVSIDQTSFNFQGGLSTKGGYLGQGTSNFKGPMVIEGPVELKNTAVVDAWAPLNSPSGPSGGDMDLTLIPGTWRG